MLAVLALLFAATLSGCVDDAPAGADLESLEVYRFVYPGAELAVPGAEHGWLFRLHNPANESVTFFVGAYGVEMAKLGPAGAVGWGTEATPPATGASVELNGLLWGGKVTVAAGASVAYMASIQKYAGGPAGLMFVDTRGATRDVPVSVEMGMAGAAVQPGDHVQTVTVGVWTNGTSFYTNSRSLLDDSRFPAGGNIDLAEARQQTDPLPVYVYGEDRTEQPAGSKDTCHFTTITGYNALLKTQVDQSTGVRWMTPEDAYTRAGAEEHLLYGDALVFLNTVVAHDGSTGMQDVVPAPLGACFDATQYVPV